MRRQMSETVQNVKQAQKWFVSKAENEDSYLGYQHQAAEKTILRVG